MDEGLKKLITDAISAHPGPWAQKDGYGDNGGRYTSIVDANYDDILNGETGWLSTPVFNLLLNFPEVAEDILGSFAAGQ
jgi:hypothetical protein